MWGGVGVGWGAGAVFCENGSTRCAPSCPFLNPTPACCTTYPIVRPASIIEPLASRCSKFRFRPLGPEAMLARLEFVCAAESVDVTPETLAQVLRISGGDMRKAITFLQSAADLYDR